MSGSNIGKLLITKAKMKEARTTSSKSSKPLFHSVGRRKKSVARIWFTRGKGDVVINGEALKDYFDTDFTRQVASTPLRVCPVGDNYDVYVNVNGGGKHGQADAIKLGIARVLVQLDQTLRPALRKYGLLTVDARNKERKKYGQRGARRKFQFVKR